MNQLLCEDTCLSYQYPKLKKKTGRHTKSKKQIYVFWAKGTREGIVKVGISNSWERRLREVKTYSPYDLQCIYVWETDENDVRYLEDWLHKKLTVENLEGLRTGMNGEWFNMMEYVDDMVIFNGEPDGLYEPFFDLAGEIRKAGYKMKQIVGPKFYEWYHNGMCCDVEWVVPTKDNPDGLPQDIEPGLTYKEVMAEDYI